MDKIDTKYLAFKFLIFCFENPDLRFWQALRTFLKVGYIYTSKEYTNCDKIKDTFYITNEELIKGVGKL